MPEMNEPGVWKRIVTGVHHAGLGDWRVFLRYENTEHGTTHTELSRRHWPTEEAARRAAEILAPAMRDRITKGN